MGTMCDDDQIQYFTAEDLDDAENPEITMEANHIFLNNQIDETNTEDDTTQDGHQYEEIQSSENTFILPDSLASLSKNADGRTILLHDGCEYFISGADELQDEEELQDESLQMINDGICEDAENSNSGSVELRESNYNQEYIEEFQTSVPQEEHSTEDEDLRFEEVEYLEDYDNSELNGCFPEPIMEPKRETVLNEGIKNIPITGKNKITGQTLTLTDFEDEIIKHSLVNNFIADGKFRLGRTKDGKNIFGIIKKIEKGGLKVEQENTSFSTNQYVPENNTNSQDSTEEEYQTQYEIPNKNESVDIKKILMGLMKLQSFEKTIGQKNLRIKYIVKRGKKGSIISKQTKLFLAQMVFLLNYDSYNNSIKTWKLNFRKGNAKTNQDIEDDEIPFAETVSLSIIILINEFGHKKTKVVVPNKGGPVKCNICGKVFRTEGLRRRHVNSTHTRYNQHPCDLCGKSYSDRSSLVHHRKRHSGDRAFKCEVCGKSFNTGGSLKRHVTVHNPSLRPHKCTDCGHRFTDISSLKKHEKIHKGVREYQCNICHREFIHIGDLNFHQKIHNEVKPYSCNLCRREFSRQANLHRHMEIHDNAGTIQNFPCEFCDCTYKFASSLTRHIVTTHLGH